MRAALVTPSLPPAFIEWWKSLIDQHNGRLRPAYRDLLKRYDMWHDIPGYADAPKAHPATGIPLGWSYRNLSRFAPASHLLTARKSILPRVKPL